MRSNKYIKYTQCLQQKQKMLSPKIHEKKITNQTTVVQINNKEPH